MTVPQANPLTSGEVETDSGASMLDDNTGTRSEEALLL
jgi:hypothetical protein